jgi:hypothetical protein
MAMYLSPLVKVNEIDLTTTIPAVATSIGVIVVRNTWKGPELKVQLVNDIDELIEVFGRPEEANDGLYQSYEDLIAAAGFLQYGNNLYCTRVLPVSATFAGVYGTIDNLGRSISSSSSSSSSSISSSSSSSISSSSISSSTSCIYSNPLVNKSDWRWWTVSAGYPLAPSAGFQSENLEGTKNIIALWDNWVNSFRPTKIKFDWYVANSGNTSFYLKDIGNNIIASGISPTGGIFDITWGSQDLRSLVFYNNTNPDWFQVTNIEFFNCVSCTQEWVESKGVDGDNWHVDFGEWNVGNDRYEPYSNGGWQIWIRRDTTDEVPPFPQKMKFKVRNDIGWSPNIDNLSLRDASDSTLAQTGSTALSGGDGVLTTFVFNSINYQPSGGKYQPLYRVLLQGGSNKVYLESVEWWDDCNSSSSSSSSTMKILKNTWQQQGFFNLDILENLYCTRVLAPSATFSGAYGTVRQFQQVVHVTQYTSSKRISTIGFGFT